MANGTTGQKIAFQNGGLIVKGVFRRPLTAPLSDSNLINNLLRFVYKGNLYQYWKTDNKSKTMNFVQTYGNKPPVFISSRNLLQFSIKNGKLTSYRQSFFKFDKTNVVDVISATTAINNLWEKDDIPLALHPVIEKAEMSYLNLVGDAESNQLVFVPCWHIEIKTDNGLSEYFVNAVSGTVQTIE
ncbi:two-component system regulatory protein YycI [Terrilactibacillus sp. S3-3]|nr:two-component system regulatory protein YycI [Terrilactibacillus sp. S3-3]